MEETKLITMNKVVTKNMKRRIKMKKEAEAKALTSLPPESTQVFHSYFNDLSRSKQDEIVEMMNKAYSEQYVDKVERKVLLFQHIFWLEVGVTDPKLQNGKVVAAGALKVSDRSNDEEWKAYGIELPETFLFVNIVTTDKYYRNRGYSTRMMREMVDWIKNNVTPPASSSSHSSHRSNTSVSCSAVDVRHALRPIYLECTQCNIASQTVYKKLGFEKVASRPVSKYQYDLMVLSV